ncbi:MAG: GIY-YIG nuclease family protein [Pyrinomonadaceae bacterium]
MDKKAAKAAYKASVSPMGIFQIRNLVNNKVFIGSSVDLRAIFNRTRFQLCGGVHPIKEFCSDWRRFGTTKFEFEVLEELTQDLADHDYTADLEALEDLWLEKLLPYGDRGYNDPKRTREERLRLITANKNA